MAEYRTSETDLTEETSEEMGDEKDPQITHGYRSPETEGNEISGETEEEEPKDEPSEEKEPPEETEDPEDMIFAEDIYDMSREDIIELAAENQVEFEDLDGLTTNQLREAFVEEFNLPSKVGFEKEKALETLPDDVKEELSSLRDEVGKLRRSREFVSALERNPVGVLADLIGRFGVADQVADQLGYSMGGDDSDGGEVDLNQIVPGDGEDIIPYLQRLVKAAVQSTGGGNESGPKRPAPTQTQQQPDRGAQAVGAVLEYLDKEYPDWPNYEPQMRQLIAQMPWLSNNPDELYARASGKRRAQAQNRRLIKRKSRRDHQTGERGRPPVKVAKGKNNILRLNSTHDRVEAAWDMAKAQLNRKAR